MRSCKRWLFSPGIVLFCFISANCFSQSGEFRYLRDINPRYPTNPYYKALSSTAKPLAFAIPFGMIAVSMIKEDQRLENNAYEIVAGLLVASAATEVLKVAVNRPRPYKTHNDIYPDEIDDGSSFPSGHTSIAFAAATSVWLVSKKWYYALPAFAWASGVAYSRLYLGQHYPSDVVAGAIVGAGSAWAGHWLSKKFFGKKKKQIFVR